MRFCPKCWNSDSGSRHCDGCGHPMVDWNLKCECGTEVRPIFFFSMPLQKRPLYKYCQTCGLQIDQIATQEAKRLKAVHAKAR